jgi:hypothetical protein
MMSDRKYRKTPAVELEAKLRAVFAANKDIFEELVVRGWSVSLSLPTHGTANNLGYSPLGLEPNAGFHVARSVTPWEVSEAIRADTGPREVLR